MEIRFECDKCGQHITAPDDMIGCVFNCPNAACGCSLTVPSSSMLRSALPIQVDEVEFHCPLCQQQLAVDKKGAGMELGCPKCGKTIVVPKPAVPVAPVALAQPMQSQQLLPPPQPAPAIPAWTPPPPPVPRPGTSARQTPPPLPPPLPQPVPAAPSRAVSVPPIRTPDATECKSSATALATDNRGIPDNLPEKADAAKRLKLGWVFLFLWVLLSFGLPLLAIFMQHLSEPAGGTYMVREGITYLGTDDGKWERVPTFSVYGSGRRWPFVLLYTLPFLLSPLLVLSLRRLSRAMDAWFSQFKTDSIGGFVKSVIDLLIRPGRLKPSSNSMLIAEKDFREAVRRVVKGVIVIVALIVLEGITCSLLKTDSYFLGMSINEWITLIITLVIVGLALKFCRPVKTIVTFYLVTLVQVGKMPDRDKFWGNLVAVAGHLTLLIYVVSLYLCLLPRITECNDVFMNFRSLTTILNVSIGLVASGILLILWKNAQPLIDPLSHINVRLLIGSLVGPSRLKPSSNSMLIAEKDFREAVRRVVKGVISIVALIVLEDVACSFLKTYSYFLGMSIKRWIEVVITLVIVGLAIKLYQSIKTILTFRLTAFVKVGRLAGRDKYLGNLVAATENLTLLVYVVFLYLCLLPRIAECNYAFMHFESLITILNMSIGLAAIGLLFVLWKNAQPLLDLLTGQITDKVSTLSTGNASVDCPACQTKNDRDAVRCISCGGAMPPQTVAAPINKGGLTSKTKPGLTKHTFISHSSQNHESAERICAVLEGFGLNCWIAPRDIEPGASYDEEILRGIEYSQTFIVLLSDAANASPHVKRELMCALRAGHTVYPIRIQEVQPGPKLEYLLEGIHWIDAWMPPIEAHLERLAQLIAGSKPNVGSAHERAATATPTDTDNTPAQNGV